MFRDISIEDSLRREEDEFDEPSQLRLEVGQSRLAGAMSMCRTFLISIRRSVMTSFLSTAVCHAILQRFRSSR